MLVRIPRLLDADRQAAITTALGSAAWDDGRITAGPQSAQVKRNLQVRHDDLQARAAGEAVVRALEQDAEAVARWLAELPAAPRILCGDLNTPRRELPDGDVLTFAHESSGRLRPERGERWDAAERALVHDLRAAHGWTDAYRALHGYAPERRAALRLRPWLYAIAHNLTRNAVRDAPPRAAAL